MNMVYKVLILAIVFISLAVLGLGVNVFFSKKKKFPQGSISKNKDMQKLNITCVKHDELHACGIEGGCCDNQCNNDED